MPYVKGYFAACGKFRSDDVKTGDIIAYTGSTSSAFYFPDRVENGEESYDIDVAVQQAPLMEGGENYRVQQGAGMAVTASDELHEYASCEFLKWFTQKEQNLRFACDSSYMPVLKESNRIEALDEVIAEKHIEMNEKTYSCLKTVMDDFDNTTFYTTKNFKNGYNVRQVLEFNLSDRAEADKAAIDAAVAEGASREDEIAKYTSDESFENWYVDFCDSLKQTAAQ